MILFKLPLLTAAATCLFGLASASPVAGDVAPAMVKRDASAGDGSFHTTELLKRAPGPCELFEAIRSSPANEGVVAISTHASDRSAVHAAGSVIQPQGNTWVYSEVAWPGAGKPLRFLFQQSKRMFDPALPIIIV